MRPRAAGVLALLAACSKLSTTEGGIGSVEIALPSPAEVEVGGTLQLTAIARGTDGETLDVPIYWRALDTTIAVDSVGGRADQASMAALTGRVVARAVDLYSAIATFTVLNRRGHPRPDRRLHHHGRAPARRLSSPRCPRGCG